MTDPGEENIAFHFNPRFSESAVVMNSKIDGDWGEEERSEEFPFQHGRDFDMDIYFKEKGYKVSFVTDSIRIAYSYHAHIPYHRGRDTPR